MLKILIVDDEEIIRDGIARKVERLFPEARIVGKADNPEQVFKLVKTEQPNLIITDIRMPEIDGLQMIEQIKRINGDIKFILISGYQEFEYAKKGIELNVEDYLLKPIENQQLKIAIERIYQKIEAERSRDNYIHELKDQVNQGIYFLKSKYLTDLIFFEKEYDIKNLINVLQQIEIRFIYPFFVVLSILLNANHENISLDLKPKICDIVTKKLAAFGVAVVFENLKKDNQIVAILNCIDGFGGSSSINTTCCELLTELRSDYKLNITIGVGNVLPDIKSLHHSYCQSFTAAIQKVVLGENRVIHIEDIPNSNQVTFFISETTKQLFISYIKLKDTAKAIEIINQIFVAIKTQGLSYQTIKTLCIDMSIILGKLVKDQGSSLENIFNEDVFSEDFLSKYASLEEFKGWLLDTVTSICNYLSDLQKSDGKKVVREIKEYITNYYYLDINLNELAKKYYLNISYLSQLFKTETGEKFVDFHTRIRIEKAKDLLEKTNLASYKIAEMVGYHNSRYFSELFVKYVGATPTKFREKIG